MPKKKSWSGSGLWRDALFLMVFSVLYSPLIGIIGGGIFNYFQMLASYLAVPIATVFLVGVLWKKATPGCGILLYGDRNPSRTSCQMAGFHRNHSEKFRYVESYSLDNFFIISGITLGLCIMMMVAVSLVTRPKPYDRIASLLVSKETIMLPAEERKRPLVQSLMVWWGVFALFYAILYVYLW